MISGNDAIGKICIKGHKITACRSNAGWYIGTMHSSDDSDYKGPYCRISDYAKDKEGTSKLELNRMQCGENAFCNGCGNCLKDVANHSEGQENQNTSKELEGLKWEETCEDKEPAHVNVDDIADKILAIASKNITSNNKMTAKTASTLGLKCATDISDIKLDSTIYAYIIRECNLAYLQNTESYKGLLISFLTYYTKQEEPESLPVYLSPRLQNLFGYPVPITMTANLYVNQEKTVSKKYCILPLFNEEFLHRPKLKVSCNKATVPCLNIESNPRDFTLYDHVSGLKAAYEEVIDNRGTMQFAFSMFVHVLESYIEDTGVEERSIFSVGSLPNNPQFGLGYVLFIDFDNAYNKLLYDINIE